MFDKFREECGVFGIYAPGHDVARLTFFGLYALQHRGQESAGIVASDGIQLRHRKAMGYVSEAFDADFRQFELAEELGFDTIWIAEHLFSTYGVVTSTQVLAAARCGAVDARLFGKAACSATSGVPLHALPGEHGGTVALR